MELGGAEVILGMDTVEVLGTPLSVHRELYCKAGNSAPQIDTTSPQVRGREGEREGGGGRETSPVYRLFLLCVFGVTQRLNSAFSWALAQGCSLRCSWALWASSGAVEPSQALLTAGLIFWGFLSSPQALGFPFSRSLNHTEGKGLVQRGMWDIRTRV